MSGRNGTLTRPRRTKQADRSSAPAKIRVAIYCRQSVDKGPGQDMTSCEAQRQAVQAYVESQRGEGWIALPGEYSDQGYSGSTTERPAFQRLLADIEGGQIDVVATYKFDRISRSQRDFLDIIKTFERHGVAFVSVTQQFNTATSTGQLLMNLLMCFAQFEREQISERIRDKISASRRQGFWSTGKPPMGYRLENKRLVIHEAEADVVRGIFRLYLDLGTLSLVVNELNRRGAVTKTGKQWTKKDVHRILTHLVPVGKVSYKDEIYTGQHEAIIDQETWDAAQALLKKNAQRGGCEAKNKWNLLLKGLLYCGRCGYAMTHTFSRRGPKRYHYYVCLQRHLGGSDACTNPRVSANDIESFVVERIREVGWDPSVLAKTIEAAQEQSRSLLPGLRAEARRLEDRVRRLRGERGNLLNAISKAGKGAPSIGQRIGELDEDLSKIEVRRAEVRAEIVAIESGGIDKDDIRAALAEFNALWDQLVARERARILQLLIERIDYDGKAGEVTINYRAAGIRTLGRPGAESVS